MTTHVTRRSNEEKSWKQYIIIRDGRVTIMHMVPALFGWNVGHIDQQGGDDWPGMSADSILLWKQHNGGDFDIVDGGERDEVLSLEARKAVR